MERPDDFAFPSGLFAPQSDDDLDACDFHAGGRHRELSDADAVGGVAGAAVSRHRSPSLEHGLWAGPRPGGRPSSMVAVAHNAGAVLLLGTLVTLLARLRAPRV